MAKTEEGGRDRVVIDYPRDLLKTLVSLKSLPAKFEEDKVVKKEEIELSLGLSLNGRFGVDPKGAKLTRSSSIPGFNVGNGDEEAVIRNGFSSASSLVKARSLPAETAEWRKRKEVQSLRRMEAKRKRSDKQGSMKGVRDRTRDNGGGDRIDGNLNGFSGMGKSGWDCDSACAGGGFGGYRSDKLPPLPPSSKASVGSQGSGSSAISEPDNQLQPINGNNASGEAQSPASNQPSPESDQKLPVKPKKEEMAGVGKVGQTMAKELIRKVLVDMPCVSTKGEGPNGKRIEGFLYRYKKGEEVRIVCVCHGQFLSPAEFVRHAGGLEVANPLKHIVVSTSFFYQNLLIFIEEEARKLKSL